MTQGMPPVQTQQQQQQQTPPGPPPPPPGWNPNQTYTQNQAPPRESFWDRARRINNERQEAADLKRALDLDRQAESNRLEEIQASRANRTYTQAGKAIDMVTKAANMGKSIVPKIAKEDKLKAYDTPAFREWNNPTSKKMLPLRKVSAPEPANMRAYTQYQVPGSTKNKLDPRAIEALKAVTLPSAKLEKLHGQSDTLRQAVKPTKPMNSDLSSVKRASIPRLGKIQQTTMVKNMSNTPIGKNTLPSSSLAKSISLPKPSLQSNLSNLARPNVYNGPNNTKGVVFQKPVGVGTSSPMLSLGRQVLSIRKPQSKPNYYKRTMKTFKKEGYR